MHELIQRLGNNGWKISEEAGHFDLPADLRKRYPELPPEVGSILAGIRSCVAADERSWLLCLRDYRGESDSAFAWNEFERQSLEAAEGNEPWRSEIQRFWTRHFPIYLSVRDGYEYAAIHLKQPSFGQVVSGREPEYEDATPVAASFSDFVAGLE